MNKKHSGKRNHVVKLRTNENTCCFSHFFYRFFFILELTQFVRTQATLERNGEKKTKNERKIFANCNFLSEMLCGTANASSKISISFSLSSAAPFLPLCIAHYILLFSHVCTLHFFPFFRCGYCLCASRAKVLIASWDPSPRETCINHCMAIVNIQHQIKMDKSDSVQTKFRTRHSSV